MGRWVSARPEFCGVKSDRKSVGDRDCPPCGKVAAIPPCNRGRMPVDFEAWGKLTSSGTVRRLGGG